MAQGRLLMAKRAARTTSKRAGDEAKPNGASPRPQQSQPTDDDVRVRAYHRYLERGAGHGSDLDDWVEAEKELKVGRQS
jgi:hypothetical protein